MQLSYSIFIHIFSSWGLTSSQVDHGLILGNSVLVNGFVIEAAQCWLDIVPLSHLEVLSEVLVSTPPVSMNHANSLVSLHLMEVGVADVVLLAIGGQTSIGMRIVVVLVVLANVPSPLRDHTFLLLFGE